MNDKFQTLIEEAIQTKNFVWIGDYLDIEKGFIKVWLTVGDKPLVQEEKAA